MLPAATPPSRAASKLKARHLVSQQPAPRGRLLREGRALAWVVRGAGVASVLSSREAQPPAPERAAFEGETEQTRKESGNV